MTIPFAICDLMVTLKATIVTCGVPNETAIVPNVNWPRHGRSAKLNRRKGIRQNWLKESRKKLS